MRPLALAAAAASLAACASAPPRTPPAELQRQVTETERAFAATMAKRDLAAFKTFLSADVVFFSGEKALRGPVEIADYWKRYYEGPAAPFSWEPEQVEVLASGNLALSTGPVRDGKGQLIATFTSIWRLEAPGQWRIVFDKGCRACAP